MEVNSSRGCWLLTAIYNLGKGGGRSIPHDHKEESPHQEDCPSRSEVWCICEAIQDVCGNSWVGAIVKLSSPPSPAALITYQAVLSFPRTTDIVSLLRSSFLKWLFIHTDCGAHRRKWYHLKAIDVLVSARKTEVCKNRYIARNTVFRNKNKIPLLFFFSSLLN